MRSSYAEILAPAGSAEAMRAAVAAGANAVYFGLDRFNARERAQNFRVDELPQTMAFLHERGVRGYVTFNTLVYQSEIEDAVRLLERISAAGVDAVIVQDFGIATLCRDLFPELPVHGSTQMTIADAASAEAARRMGIHRVILARELSVNEIAAIGRVTDVELEVFVHGALCVAYSGQCFTSASWGGRSANRGECAQACRLPYDLEVDGSIRADNSLSYLLSPLDLMGVDSLPGLLEAGVVSFKIEGRLKGPEYVAATASLYRKALDRALTGEGKELLSAEDRQILSQVYSRGASPGFLGGTNHQTVLEGTFPGHRGLRLGVVSGHDRPRQRFRVRISQEVRLRDGLLFTDVSLDPEVKEGQGGRVGRIWDLSGQEVERLVGEGYLELDVRRFPVESIPQGAQVYRSHDPRLEEQLRLLIREDQGNRIPVQMDVRGELGEPVTLIVRDQDGHESTVQSTIPAQEATGGGLSPLLLREKLGRLGGTPYHLENLTTNIAERVHLPVGELNRLRREALAELRRLRLSSCDRKVRSRVSRLSAVFTDEMRLAEESLQPTLIALCRTDEHVDASISAGVTTLLLDFMELVGLARAVDNARKAGRTILLAPPRITKPGEEKTLDHLIALGPDEILVRTLGQWELLKERTEGRIGLRGDFSLNVANSFTAKMLIDLGLRSIVPSFDLSMRELNAFLAEVPPHLCEIVVQQHIPMFHTEYCVYAKTLSPGLGFAGKSYRDCGRPCEKHQLSLRDRQGTSHPVVVDVGCRNTIFSSAANSVADEIPDFLARGVQRFRVELLRQSRKEAEVILGHYQAVLEGKKEGKAARVAIGAEHRLGVLRLPE